MAMHEEKGRAMRLTKFSDYALRTLIFAASKGEQLATIEETATIYGISRAHVKKVVQQLTRAGFLEGHRGRSGGFTLALPPERINLGAVLRATEPDFVMVECFQQDNGCVISRHCALPGIINEALAAFLTVLDRRSLADILIDARHFEPPSPGANPQRGPHLPPPVTPRSA
jgi:Rrf2 family transcriptional regulator, nitric oxide-sensitive transcriptional repressor